MIKIGTMIGDRYEVLERIGMGGMSDVYKAKDHKLNRHVAVKVLKQEFSENTNFVSKFRVEAQAAASLMHPNIVNVYDVGEDNGVYYIVMELVDGITLKKYIEKKARLSVREALSIAIQACMGIEAAHNNHIIHRDIKPQNIIISTEGKVKVTDFGIARAATSNTISSDVMGSVHYASPEQARNGFVDGKSDIYSLGIVMYEMVTGRVPFDGDTTVAVAIQHLQEEIVPPSAYAPNLPISMEKIILKCTQKNPDRRYESMTALLADLRKALISPNEDFVVIAPVSQEKTRVIGEEEINKIKQETSNIYLSDEDVVSHNQNHRDKFEKRDRFQLNIIGCAMLGAFVLCMPKRPNAEALTVYYENAQMTPLMKWFCRQSGKSKFTPKDIAGMKATAARKAADRNPYSWNMDFYEYPDGSGYEGRFTKCGICTLMQELGLYDLTPAMCHLDYAMSEAGGVTNFVRQYTLASGGPYCDCGYKKKRLQEDRA